MPEEVNRVTLSVQSTVQVKQYEPVQVFGSLSLVEGASGESVEALLTLYDAYKNVLAERVISLANETAAAARGTSAAQPVEDAPAPRKPAPRSGGNSRAASGGDGEYRNIEGRRVRFYQGKDGGPAASANCEHEGCKDGRAYFKTTTNQKTNVEYTPEQNVLSAIRFNGGLYCYNHAQEHRGEGGGRSAPAPKQAPRQAVVEDDDIPF